MSGIKERPILFNGEMVRAVLDGRKTQTRRVIKTAIPDDADEVFSWHPRNLPVENCAESSLYARRNARHEDDTSGYLRFLATCPYGVPGDRLWVRESWRQAYPKTAYSDGIIYLADKKKAMGMDEFSRRHKWKPSIHLKRVHSRMLLEVTDVRVERVQDITPADAVAEGIKLFQPGDIYTSDNLEVASLEVAKFKILWDSINEKRGFGWDVNPWVWAVTFKVLEGIQ